MDGMLLYGTNAVGKTSFIRSVGIAVIMAQAGLFVPASSFLYCPYQFIFTRILGNDNMFKGQSTFTVEMSELRTILMLGNKKSLVLGDELCSGHECGSATSIFVSGVQELSEIGCSFIFATHWHEIVDYDEIINLKSVHLKHMSVVYNRELDTLIYDRKLMDGAGDNMYGLEVCKALNLPTKFLDNAHNIRMKYQPISGSLLDRKSSQYNAKHIKGLCQNCGIKLATEVHHLHHQQDADKNGIIKTDDGKIFHKNHTANLLSLCENCHEHFHKTGEKPLKKKTTKGNTILK
jgi:DNA mismatch repair protein MutS